MWLREQGHVFDWGTLKWCQAYSSPPTGCYDAETIALDEFGHIEVLDHHVNYSDDRDYEDAVVQTFSRTKPKAGYDQHAFGRCDVATLQREYDVVDSIAKYSTCLDIDSVLTISGPSSVAYNGTATLSAFLEVVDVAAYDRLRGNNLSKRTVKLQRRPPGTTDLDDRRDDDPRQRLRDLCRVADPACRHGVPGHLRDAERRRLERRQQRDHHRPRRVVHRDLPAVGGPGCGKERAMTLPSTRRMARRVTIVGGLALLCTSVVAGCATGGPAPSPGSSDGTGPVPPVPSLASAVPSADLASGRSAAPPTASDVIPSEIGDAPPAARLTAEGGDPVTGQLGTYTWAGAGSDSPWLHGAPLAVGHGEPLTLAFHPAIDIATWRARYVPVTADDPTGAIVPRRGRGCAGLRHPRCRAVDRRGRRDLRRRCGVGELLLGARRGRLIAAGCRTNEDRAAGVRSRGPDDRRVVRP